MLTFVRSVSMPWLLKRIRRAQLKLVPVHRVQVTPTKACRFREPTPKPRVPEKVSSRPFEDLIPSSKVLILLSQPNLNFTPTTKTLLQPQCRTVPSPLILLRQLCPKALET